MPHTPAPSTQQVAQVTNTMLQARDYLRTGPPLADALPLLDAFLDEDTGIPMLLGDVLRSAARLVAQQCPAEPEQTRLITSGLREAAQEATDWHVLHWDVQRLRQFVPAVGQPTIP
ncbi:hypothetical protein OG554_05365 [Streptomyces griseus]|uniref:hypothetical protein n=1 Tax=Streptomyces griseus TaxID=1911 RepID=UPI00386488DF|nr:hypothetical protein OG554_05365 [Streptomyces fimicarius]